MQFVKRYCIIIILIFISNITSSQSINIVGSVVDSNSQKPIAFASIKVKGSNKGVLTDIDGKFTISKISFPYQIIIDHVGYAQKNGFVKYEKDLKAEFN